MNINSNKYRPDIDGLRAFAVVSVILFHAQFYFFNTQIFQGGFLGVDIFFVISGYLISKIIFEDVLLDKKFSFLNFFQRRIRRILPILFFVISIFLLIAYFVLLPNDLVLLAKSIFSQVAFISNMFFWSYYHFSYMAEDALLIPFLHTWSLSIEEQFYLVFPALVLIGYKFLKKYLVQIMVFIIIVSLIATHILSYKFPSFNFYLITSRGWEFLFGSIFAYFEIKKIKIRFLNDKYKNFITLLSFILIILSFIYFNENINHPSVITLIPVISTTLLIYYSSKDQITYKILSFKPFVKIGLISYSLYLWHYPIFAFFRYSYINNFEKDNLLKFILIVLTFIISFISYHLIEKTFRNKKINFKFCLFFILILILPSLYFSFNIIKENGYKNRLDLSRLQSQYLIEGDVTTKEIVKDEVSQEKNKKQLFILGNSHGEQFNRILLSNNEIKKVYDINFYMIQISCINNFINLEIDKCKRFFTRDSKKEGKKIINKIKNADLIIIKSRIYNDDLNEINNVIKLLKKFNKKILLFSTGLEIKKNDLDNNFYNQNHNILKKIIYNRSFYLERFILSNDRVPNKIEEERLGKIYYRSVKPGIGLINENLKKIAELNKIEFIDYNNEICSNVKKVCSILTNNKKSIFKDEAGHITDDAIFYLSSKINFREKIINFDN
jgi:peptidoglycan/LPS O-acetylase OafA/YrhL